ncbi:MAG: sigma-54-dependent Fis family transcriptional regulator, partial [Candidatus Puniceispirillum sp.]
PADIVPISTILLARHAATVDDLPFIDAEAQALLLSYKWPGNVRELENVLQRALVLMSGGQITQSDIMVDGSFDLGLTNITSPSVYSTASATA